ncbi:MAG: polysaccharide biosynthesis/export family protein [Kordiimonadaceae bacterium]|nr:polysaccharide biosynthesis/export family protein [Kordiimonadaceae bacterium]MBO6569503.1 polysaccharide biosynthesis/export family protein [Kordiimonadaceae bacterium]MBO6964978.1 polysaccharide biosynthesis/export family protein [Kordiimonadaceae bacterium]
MFEWMNKTFRNAVSVLLIAAFGVIPPVAAQTVPITQDAQPVNEGNNPTVERRVAFGSWIFGGEFANQSFIGFNPNYEIAIGDRIALQLWGGFDFAGDLVVDAQGNVFIPKVGPVEVQGVKNQDLNGFISDAVKKVFLKNVGVYASLGGAEPVKVFVTGFVRKAGLFQGHSSDSVLYFLDSAGGIDPDRGSFLDVKVIRDGKELRSINLYDFILTGALPSFQILDGDTIVVRPVQSRTAVVGDVQNRNAFEFDGDSISAPELLALARPNAQATHVRINRNNRERTEIEYVAIESVSDTTIYPGDVLEVVSDKLQGTISVRVEGEHNSSQEFVLAYGATMGELLSRIDFGPNAQRDAVQLLRKSVKERQKETLEAQLRALEASVLTARSKTAAEAQLRQQEAALILQWVERARDVEPKGQVSLGNASSVNDILLEQDDIIRIPRTSNLVMVHGDVLFPSAMAYQDGNTIEGYINQAGGFTQSRGASNVLVLHRDGSFKKISKRQLKSRDVILYPGDEIFVLPKVQTKSFQLAQDIITIFYQLALSAGVVLRL